VKIACYDICEDRCVGKPVKHRKNKNKNPDTKASFRPHPPAHHHPLDGCLLLLGCG